MLECLLAEIKTNQEEMKAILKAGYEEMKAHQARMMAVMKVCLEETEYQSEHQEVPKEEAVVETIRTLEDQYGDWHLAIWRFQQPMKRTQGSGGSQKKWATHRQMSGCDIPACHKACGHKGQMVKKRQRKRPECNNGIRNRDLRQQL
jgi:hypothetical protein